MAAKIELGLIGYPLGHSFSPGYFKRKFQEEGVDGSYDLFPIETVSEIERLLEEHPGLRGFNVTMPHKENVIPLLDSISEDAAAIGAVNTVRIDRRPDGSARLAGFNTDWQGFRDTLVPLLRPDIDKALVLGTGGAAKAAAYTLKKLGIKSVFVSRNPAESPLQPAIGYEDVSPEVVAEHKLIVNCSPVGMNSPKGCKLVSIPVEAIGKEHVCYDMIYNPVETPLLREARARGATATNGLGMLHRQADLAWNIWI